MQKEAMNLKLMGKGNGSSWREGRVGEMSQLNYNFKDNQEQKQIKRLFEQIQKMKIYSNYFFF